MSDYIDELPPEDPYGETAPVIDQAVFAEQSVLGGMMLSAKALKECLELVDAASFNLPKHEVIFTAIRTLSGTDAPVDVVSVTDELLRTGLLHQAGGVDYLHALTSIVPTAANAGYYAGIVADAAIGRGVIDVGKRLQQDAVEPGVAIARAVEDLRKLQDQAATGAKSVRWLREVLEVPEDEDAYDWVIPGLLERQDRLMLSAAEGVGKSTFLRQIAILAAAGIHPFQFTPIEPVNVLVIDAENSERQWRRAARSLTERSQMFGSRDPRNFLAVHCVPVMDITKPHDLAQIHRWIDEARPDVLLLGPLYRMTSGSLNKEEDAKPVLNALDSIRERDLAMLIEVHAGLERDSAGERGLRPRGSSTLLGWPEFGLGLRRDKVQEGRVGTFSMVRWRGDRDRREWPRRLIHGQQWPWEPSY